MTIPDFSAEGELELGGLQVLGDISVHVRARSDLDIQKGEKSSGATIKDKGSPPKEVTIVIRMWEQEQIDHFDRNVLPLLQPKAINGARDPLAIKHPKAARHGISAIIVGDIDDPPSDPVIGQVITVSAVQWFPAPRPAKQPGSTPKDKAGPNSPQALDDGIAGSGWRPSQTDAAVENLGL